MRLPVNAMALGLMLQGAAAWAQTSPPTPRSPPTPLAIEAALERFDAIQAELMRLSQAPQALRDEATERNIDALLRRLSSEQAELHRLMQASAEADAAAAAASARPGEAVPARGGSPAPAARAAALRPDAAQSSPPAPASAAPAVAPAEGASAPRPDVAAPSTPATPAGALVARGRDLFEAGDIAGARLMFDRAASARDPDALAALARSYDPDVLGRMRVRGVRADRTKADALYREAQSARAAAATGALKP
ncbi:hypothetical protein ABEG18_06110 [Alsobacter sp. KACC 23698]|uniref:YbgF trimerisation domain-containing protein n=1 Tax=Alsobacter sp. KACC 23698 TaxID=3149229 RepID=A0AAU7JJH7_9HYPH